ncbi:MAG: MoaD/ThiS family protein [Clostridia bacterium]|jgi:molybdopterin converting factor small subunit|nr:MoaD/ThiS family protein [Clostridia bacterium]MBQ4366224.1 MoaD/ThiS family protein [Clostridia bacterium]MBQ6092528.1 MoaD/ThiS family protein [Clostridia bacterium]MBR3096143.1 MoaD/ThiS family protein [Clostridia bacterium]
MAKVKVKLFGVYRVDTHLSDLELEAERLSDLLDALNEIAVGEHKSSLAFTDATVFINGEHCKKKKQKLADGDELWLLSPASGG